MQILQKKNEYGTYYLAKTALWVDGKRYTVTQTRSDPKKAGPDWKLMRSQMISILRHTKPADWLFRMVGHFDGQIDGWQYVQQNFAPANRDIIKSVITDLEDFEDTVVVYNTEEKDISGNQLKQGEINICNPALFDYRLKPSNDFIRIEL